MPPRRTTIDAETRAETLAGELIARAAGVSRSDLWKRTERLEARELAWALKRRSDAAWTTDPAATLLVAELIDELARRRPEPEVDALAAWARGIAELSQGQMEAALAPLAQAADSFAAQGRRLESAQTLLSRMMALAMLGQYEEAATCGERARQVFDTFGDTHSASKVEVNLGNLAYRRDLYEDAAQHYRNARARCTDAGDGELWVMASKGLADMLARQHDLDAARELYDEALATATRDGLALLTAGIEGEIGVLEMRRGRYDRALQFLEKSRRGYETLDAPHYLAVAEESLADAYLELNLLPEALTLYDRSLVSYEAAGMRTDMAWALAQRGHTLTRAARLSEAARTLARANELFAGESNAVGRALVALRQAELAFVRRDWAEAAHHARGAEAPLAQARQMSWCLEARGLLAETLRKNGATAEARTLAARNLEDARELGLPLSTRRVHVLLGRLARDAGDAPAARAAFEAAVASIEAQRSVLPGEELRSAFLGDNLVPYRELVRASLEEGGPLASWQALCWVERARARALADAMDEPGSGQSDDPDEHAAARLRQRLNACYRQLARPADDASPAARLHEEVHGLEARLAELGRRRLLAGPRVVARPRDEPNLGVLLYALGTHSALVEYFAIKDRLLVCVASDQGVVAVDLPAGAAEVASWIEQLRFQTDSLRHGAARVAHRMPELERRARHHLRRLHEALWAPIVPLLGKRRAVVVPHANLHYLPFEALHDGQRHEVEVREICRAPSAAVLLRCLERPPSPYASALVLGHGNERLPHVEREAQAVAAGFPPAAALLGAHAAGTALAAYGANADVLHIACHAQFRNDNPRFSALHLADGAFTVRDASRLALRCGLLTLSACETGVSAVMPGDELIGLTHGFLSAGAASVMASLWTVQDEAASGFMQRFYTHLRERKRPGAALRAAQIEALATHPHPYFWAAFTLHGRW